MSKTSNKMNNTMPTVGSFFAGIGGIDLGFQQAGFWVKWANEIDKHATETYRANHRSHLFCEDIRTLSVQGLESVDIVTAGFPCQAFSVAGYRKGFLDERGSIFFELLRFVKGINPSVVFLENVKNLLSHEQGQTFKIITKHLGELKYYVHHACLNTCEISDLPQNRERVYIVAFKDRHSYEEFEFPKKNNRALSVKTLLEKEVPDKYYYTHTKYYPILKQAVKSSDTVYQWRRKYVRENKNNLCPTLTANMGTGGHNVPLVKDAKGIRKLTPRECARLQGFEDTFILPESLSQSHIYKQIGNSVSVPVIKRVAQKILYSLQYA